ncbi:MAG: hypothetical protein WCG27_06920 [Pseudomonadota bacterium]
MEIKHDQRKELEKCGQRSGDSWAEWPQELGITPTTVTYVGATRTLSCWPARRMGRMDN